MKHFKHSDDTAIICLKVDTFSYSTYTEQMSKTLLNFNDFYLLTIWRESILKNKLKSTGKWMNYVETILQKEFRQ
jgi:hypothetical protein